MDEKCRQFCDLTRQIAASIRGTANDCDKKDSVQLPFQLECVAKLILFDQIARNAFRFQSEAFAYDDLVIETLHNIFQLPEQEACDTTTTTVPDQVLARFVAGNGVTLCDCFFVSVACQHQEKRMFHGVDERMLRLMEARWPACKDFVKIAISHSESHAQVLKRFGRYPHRNHVYGRENTHEEMEWMSDYDNLPIWVKSQLPKKA